ncbi:methyltransferase [Flavobacteriaceae bacterium]|nr:methyltransferase [Flavobacteriaceae bacterium]
MSTNNNPLLNSNLAKIIDLVSKANPLQKKKILSYVSNQDEKYFLFAENLSKTIIEDFLTTEKEQIDAAAAYNKMCMDFLKEQIRFKKTGVYRIDDAAIANEEVYSDPLVMRYYMVGLLISYMFWPNHYQLFQFFKTHLPVNEPKSYLEVGVGHGLFSSTMLKTYPNIQATCVDISETSIKTAKEVLQSFHVNTKNIDYVLGDFFTVDINKKFDFIIMGEVLEHVNDAYGFMRRAKEFLKEDGRIYMSTAANSPALDHVYHFHNEKEITDLLDQTGFLVEDDLVLPADDIPKELWEQELVTLNYCCILKHK